MGSFPWCNVFNLGQVWEASQLTFLMAHFTICQFCFSISYYSPIEWALQKWYFDRTYILCHISRFLSNLSALRSNQLPFYFHCYFHLLVCHSRLSFWSCHCACSYASLSTWIQSTDNSCTKIFCELSLSHSLLITYFTHTCFFSSDYCGKICCSSQTCNRVGDNSCQSRATECYVKFSDLVLLFLSQLS